MISCSDCILQKKGENCRACRNLIGKLYLDFLTEIKDLIYGPKDNRERVYAAQDCVALEEQMIKSFTPEKLKDRFKLIWE